MTELIWDGKYDKDGRKVAPPRIILPFQTVETVNESAADRDRNLNLFGGQPTEWRNRLIWGDKRYVLPSLLPEFAGKVNLIYIDPPFDTGANFSYMATVPDDPDTPGDQSATFVKEPSVIEQKAYRDTWGRGLDSYLKWFYETVVLLRELLADDGSLYVHLDWRLTHYARAVLDEVFGEENYRNEMIWKRAAILGRKADARQYGRVHDTILYYTKSSAWIWNKPLMERLVDIKTAKYDAESNAYFKTSPRGDYTDKSIAELRKQNRIYDTGTGGIRIKYFFEQNDQKQWVERLPADSLWLDIPDMMHIADSEKVGYPTQKPEALLERIIKTSTNPGDLVLDCFCGSGTTAAVAEKLGRRWITCDLGRFAIHTTRKRLLGIEGVKPFTVQNLGKYERQAWQTAEFGAKAEAINHEYRSFILHLYRAQAIQGYVWLHGVKNGRMVHVGDVAAPISVGDVSQIAAEFHRARGAGKDAPTQSSVDILGWDFAFELNEVARQQAALAGIDVRFVRIPREVLEKKAVEQGDIKFFELASLSVKHKVTGRSVHLELTDFIIPLDDVPQEIQAAITHWEQWVDYWAVDWDNKGDTFHNQWQAYRTRKDKTLQKTIVSPSGPDNPYAEPGEYKIVVKVIDILGNDTTKTLLVSIS